MKTIYRRMLGLALVFGLVVMAGGASHAQSSAPAYLVAEVQVMGH